MTEETEKESKKEPKKEKKGKKEKKKGGFVGKLKALFLIAGAIFLLRQSVIMLMVGLLPAFVAYIVDTTNGKSWFKTVFCFNLAGLLPYLAEVYFEKGNSASAMQSQMGDFTMWLVVYLSAGLAWVFIWLCPKVALLCLRGYHEYKAEEHTKKFERLKKEWGITLSLSDQ